MKKLIVVMAMLWMACANAADDLANCRWENGTRMSQAACETFRRIEQDRQASIQQAEDNIRRMQEEEDHRESRRAECTKMKRSDLSKADKSVIMKAVKDSLKDPDSAKFKWVKFVQTESPVYCGLVNAKNSYGGYAGYEPYRIMFLKKKNGKIEPMSTILDAEIATNMCAEDCYDDFTKP